MRTWQYEKTSGIATWFRSILLGLVSFLLLYSSAYAQANRQVVFQNLLAEPAHFEKSDLAPDRTELTEQTTSGLPTALLGQPSTSRWWQTNLRSSLPPASVFTMRTNLRKYLDTWPTSGATVTPDEPPDEELTDEDLT
jgi:hypothetical protein